MTACLTIWAIYRHPSDYPDSWVLRGHEVLRRRGVQPQNVCFVGRTLDEIRSKVPPGTRCIGRQPEDHPVIHECWIASPDIGALAGSIDAGKFGASRALASEPALDRLGDRVLRSWSPEINRRILLPSYCAERSPDTDVAAGGKQLKAQAEGASADLEAILARLSRRVVEAEARVRKISGAIERGRESGLSTAVAETLLNTMLVSLSLMNRRKARIEAELKALKHGSTLVQLWERP